MTYRRDDKVVERVVKVTKWDFIYLDTREKCKQYFYFGCVSEMYIGDYGKEK